VRACKRVSRADWTGYNCDLALTVTRRTRQFAHHNTSIKRLLAQPLEPQSHRRMFRPTAIPFAFLVIVCTSLISSAETRALEIRFTPGGNCARPVAEPPNEVARARLIDGSGLATLHLANGSKSTRHTFQRYYLDDKKTRVTIPSHYERLTFSGFLALPSLDAEYDQSDWTTVRAYTQRAVSLEGYIVELMPSRDGDIRADLRDTRQPRCFPGGQRQAQLVARVTPAFQPPKTGWSYDVLLDLCQRQAGVRLSGWLLHDFQHVKDVGDGRGSAWEIHPVTKIEVWDPTRQRWEALQ